MNLSKFEQFSFQIDKRELFWEKKIKTKGQEKKRFFWNYNENIWLLNKNNKEND